MTVLDVRLFDLFQAEPPWDEERRTAWGICAELAEAHGHSQPIEVLDRDRAWRIWRLRFIVEPRLDAIGLIAPAVADAMLHMVVECGAPTVWRWLQVALNKLGGEAGHWLAIDPTGWPGAVTIHALRCCMARNGDVITPVLIGLLVLQRSQELLLDAVSADVPDVRAAAWLRVATFAAMKARAEAAA